MSTQFIQKNKVASGDKSNLCDEIDTNSVKLRRFLSGDEYRNIQRFLRHSDRDPVVAKSNIALAQARESKWTENTTVTPDAIPYGARALAFWLVFGYSSSIDLSDARLKSILPRAIKIFNEVPNEEKVSDPLGRNGTTNFKSFLADRPTLNWVGEEPAFSTALTDFKSLVSGDRKVKYPAVPKAKAQTTTPSDRKSSESISLLSLMRGKDQVEPAAEETRIKMAFTRITLGKVVHRPELFNVLLGEVVTGNYADASIQLAFSKANEVALSNPSLTLSKECLDIIVPKLLSLKGLPTVLCKQEMFNYLNKTSSRQPELATEIGAALERFVK